MARLAWGLLLLAATCSASEISRIVGGTPTSIEKYPSMVQVESFTLTGVWSQHCSGVILTSRWILTAAQCVSGPLARPQVRRIRAGSSKRNTGGTIRDVIRIVNHPTYGQNGFDGDISIIQLDRSLVYSNSIAQGSIIAQGAVISGNLPVVHAGWGRQSFLGKPTDDLTEVSVLTVDNRLCADLYSNWPRPPVVTSNMICAGILDVSAAGTCFGDAGGPLLYQGVVIGIASWGMTCSNGTYPDVSTSVASYTNWIVANAV